MIFLPIHIAAGSLALILGAATLLVRKGGPVHRRTGLMFVWAMLVMVCLPAVFHSARSA